MHGKSENWISDMQKRVIKSYPGLWEVLGQYSPFCLDIDCEYFGKCHNDPQKPDYCPRGGTYDEKN